MEVEWDNWSPPKSFVCPISGELMKDPVSCVDGHSYERSCILQWFGTRLTSPVTNESLESAVVVPNHALRSAIEEWKLQVQGDAGPLPPPPPSGRPSAPTVAPPPLSLIHI